MTPCGVDQRLLDKIIGECKKRPEIERLVLYGSRAVGTFKNHSDIDLAVYAPALSHSGFAALRLDIDALPIIFGIDLVHADTLANAALRERIQRDGVVLYERESVATTGHANRDL